MSINQATILGRVGRDAEHTTHGETDFLKFSVATSKKIKGEETTTWHNVVIIGKLAGAIKNFVRKGKEIYVSGEINNRTYEKDGQTKYFSEIVVGFGGSVHLCGGAKSNDAEPAAQSEPATAGYDLNDDVPF